MAAKFVAWTKEKGRIVFVQLALNVELALNVQLAVNADGVQLAVNADSVRAWCFRPSVVFSSVRAWPRQDSSFF